MKLSVAIVVTGITMTEASGASSSSSSKWASLRRRLSYEKIAGYNPGSQVRLLLLCDVFSYLVQVDVVLDDDHPARSTNPLFYIFFSYWHG
jgi:hypothetical protein